MAQPTHDELRALQRQLTAYSSACRAGTVGHSGGQYRVNHTTRAHLAEVVGLLGPPPSGLVERGVQSKEFSSNHGRLPLRTRG
jgi:hypothetical protein